eukprot:gene9427-11177_t
MKKLVAVGDGACGMTCLLIQFSYGRFPGEYVPTVFENYLGYSKYKEGTTEERNVELALWDTAGQEDYDKLRPLSYPDTDVVLIGYSVVEPDTLDNVIEKWSPEINHFCPGVPIILVGCKSDARTEPRYIKDLAQKGQKPVPLDDAQRVAKSIGAYAHLECSSMANIAEEVEELRKVFKAIDTNNNGTIDMHEIGQGLRLLGDNPQHIEIQRLIEICKEECRHEVGKVGEEISFEIFAKVLGPKLRLKSQTRNKDRCALIIIYCLAKRPHKSCGCYWCGCSPGWLAKLQSAFKIFDKNGDGKIDVHELMHALATMGNKLSKTETKKLIKEVDTNQDGEIDIAEFAALLGNMKRDVIKLKLVAVVNAVKVANKINSRTMGACTIVKLIKESLPSGMKLANTASDLVYKCAM